jgi:hypothetical protein
VDRRPSLPVASTNASPPNVRGTIWSFGLRPFGVVRAPEKPANPKVRWPVVPTKAGTLQAVYPWGLGMCMIQAMRIVPIALLIACGTTDDVAQSPSSVAPVASAAVLADATQAEDNPEEGWGAIFRRGGTAWKVGGGTVVVGPRTAKIIQVKGNPLACGGVAIKGAPKHGVLVLPEGAPVPEDRMVPAIQAHRIERSAWRLDEVLPARGRFDSKVPSTQPSIQRGIEVGSVTKTRRHGAPPFLISTGVRNCHGAVVFTDVKAEGVIAYDQLTETCKPLRVVPAHDYDGDGNREFAVFSDERVRLYRVTELPGKLSMTKLADWRCKAEG